MNRRKKNGIFNTLDIALGGAPDSLLPALLSLTLTPFIHLFIYSFIHLYIPLSLSRLERFLVVSD